MDIPSSDKTYIELLGQFGEFSIPNEDLKIKYFSTFANKKVRNSGPSILLKELKPMRERANSSEIDDINSLLQRDLNDSRVANELIPYLMGEKRNNIAFFPAILAALVPKGFLTVGSNKYPKISGEQDGTIFYENNWKLEVFNDKDGSPTSLGKLFIDNFETDIIVLDGQHRANAFRVICDSFEDRENSIYEAFYEEVEPVDNYISDLPVTLIWFESNGEDIDPKLISRKLFVDVNSNARPVNESRKILLNDFEPASVLTKYYYTLLATEESFKTNKFSLLHSGFDVDSDLKKSTSHVFTLTTPQIMHDINNWLFFGTRVNNQLNRYKVKQTPNSYTDLSQCDKILPLFKSSTKTYEDDNNNYKKHFQRNREEDEYLEEFKHRIFPIYKKLFDQFILTNKHFKACSDLERLYNTTWSAEKKEIWRKVFCGGEGLYYSFRNIPSSRVSDSQRIQEKLKIIQEIEDEFVEARSVYFENVETKRINSAFTSVRSKAFQIGYFMAFIDYMYDKYEEVNEEIINKSIDSFKEGLNSKSLESWINIFTVLRPAIITSGTNPRSWPAYHKIILRIVQRENSFYNKDENKEKSPEAEVFKNKLNTKLRGWLESTGNIIEEVEFENIESVLNGWISDSKEETKKLFNDVELDLLEGIDWNGLGKNYISKILEE
ncbi:hypothetical protein DYD21_18105 [Rhodohalobacter sp. SW132]|uniref:DNA sulfur modification protein DndB n=1 Tax=Rhodohalobacter sp. SW132 TaxID=2293433 RepID=UPI000E22395D|nr:DNA sulfur modification protein DndB [Rhodohalobacter sp. SW132]REL24504.1 hypothetical protein DYD21_18105 [Rhodohalobacter sp. SW132]